MAAGGSTTASGPTRQSRRSRHRSPEASSRTRSRPSSSSSTASGAYDSATHRAAGGSTSTTSTASPPPRDVRSGGAAAPPSGTTIVSPVSTAEASRSIRKWRTSPRSESAATTYQRPSWENTTYGSIVRDVTSSRHAEKYSTANRRRPTAAARTIASSG